MDADAQTVNVSTAAKILGISRNTAYSLVAQGLIPSLRLKKRILIPRRSLEKLLDGTWQPSTVRPTVGS